MEHGAIDLAGARAIIQAVEPHAAPVVRVPSSDATWLTRVIELGPAGVIVPHVNGPDEAQAVANACLYPPAGERSFGIGRAQGYGTAVAEALTAGREQLAIIVQIEHRDAVERIGEILAVEGIDCAMLGPMDLSGSLGVPGQLQHESVLQATEAVRKAAETRGLAAGTFCANADAAHVQIAAGFSIVAAGTDALLLASGAAALSAGLRGEG
jgi:2-keto-3-deoxy-L-rhamnonate aldolase RhmA